MERVQINGEWYVKESSIQENPNGQEINLDLKPTHTESLIIESSNYCFECVRCYKDNDVDFYDGIDIEFTDKRPARREDWIIENWDNMSWIKGVWKNDPESMKILKETLDAQGIKEFRFLLSELIIREWLFI
jgi:hypothetical protein